ncbi:MAG: homoserine O-acetyltransferase [Bacteroidetes bacterium]|nr:homoserine O-acetyltransferase [Bacteroidota bacterium]MBU1372577.1 homoserine O-acetyltransferase [Bacteroidota bacterium]MBU1485014.1 homoserine O-acetyltransferase [Bacteroidota bacterium]MBU1760701.1 homoserine O-acetyltransferase [Bacteroidota bacterium]MBU2269301.1 homoserine O-acetyltransferase [Bacteroidota bacterium]
MSTKKFQYKKQFKLESGKKLRNLEIAYHTFGKLNKDKSNVVWVCHALTANSDVTDWWSGLFGKNDYFNPNEHFIVCANVLGSHYGTTNPLSINPITGQPFYLAFPEFTIRDLVAAHELLANELGIKEIEILIGGSLGGQQALEWAISAPEKIKNLILLATNAQHSPWGIAFNESQRLAITADRTFYANQKDGGAKGLKAARSMALLSYRSYESYVKTQHEIEVDKKTDFKASSYQRYQGEKLVKRFNAYSYYFLTKAMDSHNVGRGRNSVKDALDLVKANTLVIGIKNDLLFPIEEQKFLSRNIKNVSFTEIESFYGHDGFLLELKTIENIISTFMKSNAGKKNQNNLRIA